MAIAYQADDIPRILKANKLAVVMGLEVDNIGDFNKKANLTEGEVHAEILRLYGEGVRYLFPIHVIDNPFGTAAAYQDLFNLSNLREAGHFYNLVCSSPEDLIGYDYTSGNPLAAARDPFTASTLDLELAVALVVKLGMADDANDEPVVPTCDAPMTGMVNRGAAYPGLTPLGKFAVLDMMAQGIFIDVDHMSQAAATDTVALAIQENYPVNSGHNVVPCVQPDAPRELRAQPVERPVCPDRATSRDGGRRVGEHRRGHVGRPVQVRSSGPWTERRGRGLRHGHQRVVAPHAAAAGRNPLAPVYE